MRQRRNPIPPIAWDWPRDDAFDEEWDEPDDGLIPMYHMDNESRREMEDSEQ